MYSLLSFDGDAWWFHLKYLGASQNIIEETRKHDPVILNGITRCLTELSNYSLEGTFFLVGSDVENYPEHHREIIEAGHEVGSHTYTHPYPFNISTRDFAMEVERTEEVIKKELDFKVKGFRAPGYQIKPEYLKVLAEKRYQYDSSLIKAFFPGYFPLRYVLSPNKPYKPSVKDVFSRDGKDIWEIPISGFSVLPLTGTYILNLGFKYFKTIAEIISRRGDVLVLNFHLRDFIDLPNYNYKSQKFYSKTSHFWIPQLRKKINILRMVFKYLERKTESITYSEYIEKVLLADDKS